MDTNITIEPATPGRWDDLARLFGDEGATEGCWCMFYRRSGAEYREGRGDGNREAMQALVQGGHVPGLIAYVDGEPAAWCALAPREEYPRIQRSPTTRPIDTQPAWSVVCFFTHADYRGQGLAGHLLAAAVEFATVKGAELIEGYPVSVSPGKRISPGDGFHGFESTFRQAGFEEAARRKPARPIMRRPVPCPDGSAGGGPTDES